VRALAVAKGKDSVVFGVQWLQQQTIVVDVHCINARNELSIYHWRKDKDGNSIRQPIDKNNHFIDALRYAYDDEYMRGESVIAFGG
jgi:phage terminase large subunit